MLSLAEGLLIILVILLVWLIYFQCSTVANIQEWNCINKKSGQMANVTVVKSDGREGATNESIESKANKQNAEYFDVCSETAAATEQVDQHGCPVNSDFIYASQPYGGQGLDYKDWAAAQAVDPQVISNHADFVKDRLDKGAYWTGRTYTPDSHDSYDPIFWIGIRGRPQAVSQCDPTQVPDIDTNLYPKTAKMAWNSVAN